MTLSASNNANVFTFESICGAVTGLASKAVERVARKYSEILDEEITSRQALHMLNAQFAFVALVLPVAAPLLYYVAVVGWFALALRGAKRAF